MYVTDYIEYVQETINKFSSIGDLVQNDEISPNRLNKALGQFYDISLSLNAEYQRQKIQHAELETDYQIWYDNAFTEAKKIVLEENESSKSAKPAMKEYEVKMRTVFKSEWREWNLALKKSEAKTQFLLRLRETLNKYDNILTTIAYNMRSEMKALSIEDRSNAHPEQASSRKQRTRFPVES